MSPNRQQWLNNKHRSLDDAQAQEFERRMQELFIAEMVVRNQEELEMDDEEIMRIYYKL